MTSSLPPLIQACSGALASASANIISYPLDLATTRLQTTKSPRLRGLSGALTILRRIVQSEGLGALYDGFVTDTVSTLLSNFLYFYFYTLLHALAARRRASDASPILSVVRRAIVSPTAPVLLPVSAEIAVGFAAGVASRAISTPLSVITVQLQSGGGDDEEETEKEGSREACTHNRGLPEIVRSIFTERGLAGFWAGFMPAIPLSLTPALTLLLFQLFRRIRVPGPRALRPARAFVDGACANALALAALYPLVLAKVRVQAWKRARDAGAPTMRTIWRDAQVQRGWAGLYDGLAAQLVKGFVSQGVTMLMKQRIERTVVSMYMQGQ